MDMREKIARVVNPFAYYEGADQCYRDDALRTADAVLEAMRETTDEMIVAGIIERHDSQTPEAWKLATANIYTAMIDAARPNPATSPTDCETPACTAAPSPPGSSPR